MKGTKKWENHIFSINLQHTRFTKYQGLNVAKRLNNFGTVLTSFL